jgi:hypothetical protein
MVKWIAANEFVHDFSDLGAGQGGYNEACRSERSVNRAALKWRNLRRFPKGAALIETAPSKATYVGNADLFAIRSTVAPRPRGPAPFGANSCSIVFSSSDR